MRGVLGPLAIIGVVRRDAPPPAPSAPELVAVDAASTAKVDHRRVAKLQSILRARHDTSTPSPPANTADGHASGYLLHQAKFQSQWKRSFFVLKGCTLYQYASEAAVRPTKAFAICFAVRGVSGVRSNVA